MGELKLPFSSDNNIFRTRGGGRSTELQDPAACRTDFYLMYFSIQNYILYVSICEINKERTKPYLQEVSNEFIFHGKKEGFQSLDNLSFYFTFCLEHLVYRLA